jgi:hypothetical protein
MRLMSLPCHGGGLAQAYAARHAYDEENEAM